MSDNKCNWKPPFPYRNYAKCSESPLPSDHKGYCLLHSEDKNKNIQEFIEQVKKRIETEDNIIDLRGCYFPMVFDSWDFKTSSFPAKPILFSWAIFSQEVILAATTFQGETHFNGATFSKKATFINARFDWVTEFNEATFKNGVDFLNATFSNRVDFSRATFSQKADFSRAKFEKKVEFSDATFSKAIFFKARFSDAYFRRATFSQWAGFARATFSKKANFWWVKFEKGANFNKTKFRESVFHHARFEGETIRFQYVDLSQCSFLDSNIDKVDFRYCKFGEVKEQLLGIIPSPRQNVLKDEIDVDENVNKKNVGTALVAVRERTGASPVPTEKDAREGYEPVRRLYQELKKNFEEKKDWNTAGDFHYGEMECRRKMKGALGREFFSLEALYRRASGYGERPWRAGFWLGTLILSFTLFYLPPTGKVSPSPKVLSEAGQALLGTDPQGTSATTTKEAFQAQPPKKRDIQSPGEATSKFERYQVWFKRYLEGLNASLRVTARLDTKETGWPRTIQSILGPLFIALFALALRRKVKR